MDETKTKSRSFSGKDSSSFLLNVGNNQLKQTKSNDSKTSERIKRIKRTQVLKFTHRIRYCEYCNKPKRYHGSILEQLDLFWYSKGMTASDTNDTVNLSQRKKSYAKYLSITKEKKVPSCIEARIKIQFSNEETIFTDGSHLEKWYEIVGKVRGGDVDNTP